MSMPTEVTAEAVHELLRTELVDLGIPEEIISPETTIDTLEIDSLDIADLMVTVKRAYGVDIRRAELAGVTIGELVDRVLAGPSDR
ncbi:MULTISPECIES: phosphopantetheine-binding protein [unclassified Streptomyces]|uniref:acyl carrier protein n=1 Tax=unclassified Streptomyces TaxID=2593676 RepID=UPI0033A5CA35